MFCLLFEISGLSAAFVEVSRFWAALPGAQHSDECIRPPLYDTWLVATEIFSLCKAILYRPMAGQISAKRACGYIKKNLTKSEISFETTDQISTSMVLDIDKGSRFQIRKARGPGKFISPRLIGAKVLKKCSILGNRSLSLCFDCFLNCECAHSPRTEYTTF